mmetsp:Transcript_26507/g.62666  ORF Transcript_26507/g.62666 Transcript_26507/m.62666 type:complete len:97 (+) Transcript_26507:198-488(+)
MQSSACLRPAASLAMRVPNPLGATQTRNVTGPTRSKEEKDAIIMRLRRSEEETRKYGAPKGQALFVGLCGVTAVGLGFWGWSNMDPRLGSIRSRGF